MASYRMMTLRPKIQAISWIWLLLAVFVGKELLWSYLTPPWQAPDEIAHYGYVETLYFDRTFPVLGQTVLSQRVQAIGPINPAAEITGYRPSIALNWIAQHPPLYYLLLEPLYAFLPQNDPLLCIFILRLVSILMGCVTLWYADKTLKLLLPDPDEASTQAHMQAGATAPALAHMHAQASAQTHAQPPAQTSVHPHPLNGIIRTTVLIGMAFLPMFSSISASVNNDNLIFMLAGMLTYLSVKNFAAHDTKGSLQMGILLGLLAFTKSTSLPLFLSIFIIEVIKHLRQKMAGSGKYSKCFLKHQAVIFGSALLIAGWWYARNIMLYQTILPDIGSYAAAHPELLRQYPNLAAMFPESTGIAALPHANLWDFFVKQNFLWEYYQNMWGAFGQFFFRLFSWQYLLIGLLTVASLCGYLKLAIYYPVRKNLKDFSREILSWKGWTMLLPLLAVGAGVTYELFKIYQERGFLGAMQGRYMFSALVAFIYLLVMGIRHLTTQKYLYAVCVSIMLFFVLNDITALLYRIIPEFY